MKQLIYKKGTKRIKWKVSSPNGGGKTGQQVKYRRLKLDFYITAYLLKLNLKWIKDLDVTP